ncbi:MAG: sensor histidine kinase [Nitrospiraceae bacterium]|nr:sensor histidine kinase [Nitrospiraceae bacterium]
MTRPLFPEEPRTGPGPSPFSDRQILVVSLGLSLAIFFLDALTPQRLVVSILQDVPIALTGLSVRRKITVLMVAVGILSNLLAEIINAHTEGTVSRIAIANRLFSVLSFLLVGYLAMRIQSQALRTGQHLSEKKRAERDRQIRTLLEQVSREPDLPAFLVRIASHFRNLFGARGTLFAGVRNGRWTLPILADPPTLVLWTEGEPIPGALTLLLASPFPPIRISQMSLAPFLEKNGMQEGYLARLDPGFEREGEGLLLFLLDPLDPDPVLLLTEILPVLEDQLRRLTLLAHLRESNADLLRKNALIQDLVWGVSHDLRTPLLAQNMNMALALEGVWGEVPDEVRTLLQQMVQSNASLLELSSRLLLLSRYELGEDLLEWSHFTLVDLVGEVVQEIGPLLQDKRLVLIPRICDTPLEGDRSALRRLLLNLLDNAVKWSPPGGEILIEGGRENRTLTITIRDSGPGIPPEMIPRLFERFGGLRPGSGFGLGLYLAQQIARLHGGRILHTAADPGCLFTLELPERKEGL